MTRAVALLILVCFGGTVRSNYHVTVHKFIETSYVYDYPAVPLMLVPAYPIVQQAAPVAVPTQTAVLPTAVAPLADYQAPLVYLQPAVVYAYEANVAKIIVPARLKACRQCR